MNKTPISILQEYMVAKKKALPIYRDEPSDLAKFTFKCTVTFDNKTVSGYANTKKEAKQQSAQLALKHLGFELLIEGNQNNVMPPRVSNNVPTPTDNYVGKLNELASMKGQSYAQYEDSMFPLNGLFLVKCIFLKWTVEGYGITKKNAKQDAARKMLENLKDINISMNEKSEKIENINRFCEAVIEKYGELSLDEKRNSNSKNSLPLPSLWTEVSSLTELQLELSKKGYESSIQMFQKDPFVMILKIKGTGCVVMGQGKTEEESCKDLLSSASIIFSKGLSFITV